MIVLDTSVISELIRESPLPAVMARVRGFRAEVLCTTAVTEAELRGGLAVLPIGRKSVLRQLDLDSFIDIELGRRILPFDSAAAKLYAVLIADRSAKGRPIMPLDAQIAAIVRSNGATLVTRNTKDFENCGFEVINPWT
ncbi:MAG TPA: type II toxin-antitoxin system VapC family toxin [Bryobacteraceae bacterium]|nr:type II toxin-antitoxin system VapC family toxin [Bryobacteraceae bacterium]